MKIIAIILLVIGVVGLILSSMMFGDIGIASTIGSIGCLLSGVCFILVDKRLKLIN